MYLVWEIAIGILAGFLAGKIMRARDTASSWTSCSAWSAP